MKLTLRLHIMSGKPSAESPGSEKTLRENLKDSIAILEEAKIVGLIEPINPYSVPGYFLNDFDMGKYDSNTWKWHKQRKEQD